MDGYANDGRASGEALEGAYQRRMRGEGIIDYREEGLTTHNPLCDNGKVSNPKTGESNDKKTK